MAILTWRSPRDLGPEVNLAPERWDPARTALRAAMPEAIPLGALAKLATGSLQPGKFPTARAVVIDTSHAREGLLTLPEPVDATTVRSTKRIIQAGDVLVSRLRPYLRQVAYADVLPTPDITWCASTEFYVLRGDDVAFLAAFLLSAPVQAVLGSAQEGGHHPRVPKDVVLNLPLPKSLLERREELNAAVISQARLARQSQRVLGAAVAAVESCLPGPLKG